MNDMEQYASSFSAGMKVEIGIPLPYAKVFHDWAIIQTLDVDMVSLQLSRDILPAGVSLRIGQVLELRSDTREHSCTCSAIVVSRGCSQELLLRLTGEVASGEPREFYRLKVYLPIKYFTSEIQHPVSLQMQWEDRCKQRLEDDHKRKKKQLEELRQRILDEEKNRKDVQWLDNATDTTTTSPRELHHEKTEDRWHDTSWDDIIASAANISGGGMSLVTNQCFTADEFVLLEILIPSPPRIVDAVVRVTFSELASSHDSDENHYNTGFQYVFIAESDRFAIVNYITSVQIKRIRHSHGFDDENRAVTADSYTSDEHYALLEDSADKSNPEMSSQFRFQGFVREVVAGLLLLCIVGLLTTFFFAATAKQSQNEIAKIFDKGIKTYLENLNK